MRINLLCRKVTLAAFLFSLAMVGGYRTADGDGPTRLQPTFSEERLERELREELRPADMRNDEGVGYVARLRLGRTGDRDSNASQCVLLEDGKPLPHPRSLHAAIRELGEGRYSHWTASQVYFSASDSSDPRTNGRKYELVSRESFVRKSAQVMAVSGHSSFRVDIPKHARVRSVRSMFQNLDQEEAAITRLVRRGDPDLSSAEAMVKSVTTEEMTDEQKAIAIWKFLVQWRDHDTPAEGRGEVHDPVKLINVYGYGFCDDSAAAFCALAGVAGLKTRSYGLSGHVVAEAFYDNDWHMFDPDHEVVYWTDDRSIASVSQLEQHPEWITRTERDPIGFPSARMADLYTTRQDNRPFQAASLPPATIRPILGPGDQVVFDFTDTRRVHRRMDLDRPWPRTFANGTWKRAFQHPGDRDGPIRIRWPYVILGGQTVMQTNVSAGDVILTISSNGNNFEPLPQSIVDGRLTASLDKWIDRQPSAIYDFWLATDRPVESATLEAYFQFAPRALAQVKPGENEFDVYLSDLDNGRLSNWKGVRAEVVWDEFD